MVDVPSLIEAVKTARFLVGLSGQEEQQVKDDSSVRESLVNEGVMIINSGGDLYLADQEELSEEGEEKIKNMFDLENNADNRVMEQSFREETKEFEEDFNEGEDDLKTLMKNLNSTYQSILNLAKVVENHYENNEHDLASQQKKEIAQMYGSRGVKLCNLYTSEPSYVREAAEFYRQITSEEMSRSELKETANETIEELLQAGESIYFVQHYSDTQEELEQAIRIDIQAEKPYIAIHSAGQQNKSLAKNVYEEVQGDAVNNDYNVSAGDPAPSSPVPRFRVRLQRSDNADLPFV